MQNNYAVATEFFFENKDFFRLCFKNDDLKEKKEFSTDLQRCTQEFFRPIVTYLHDTNDNRLYELIDMLFTWLCDAKARYKDFEFFLQPRIFEYILQSNEKRYKETICSILSHSHYSRNCMNYMNVAPNNNEKVVRLRFILDYIKPFVHELNEDKLKFDFSSILEYFLPSKYDTVVDINCLKAVLDFFLSEIINNKKTKEHYFKNLPTSLLYSLILPELTDQYGNLLNTYELYLLNTCPESDDLFILYVIQENTNKARKVVNQKLNQRENEKYYKPFEYTPPKFINDFFILFSDDDEIIETVLKVLPEKTLKKVDIGFLSNFLNKDDLILETNEILKIIRDFSEGQFFLFMNNLKQKNEVQHEEVIINCLLAKNYDTNEVLQKNIQNYLDKSLKNPKDFDFVKKYFTRIDRKSHEFYPGQIFAYALRDKFYNFVQFMANCFDLTIDLAFCEDTIDSLSDFIIIFKDYFVIHPGHLVADLLSKKSEVDLCALFSSDEIAKMKNNMKWNFLEKFLEEKKFLDTAFAKKFHRQLLFFCDDQCKRIRVMTEYGIPFESEYCSEDDRNIFKNIIADRFIEFAKNAKKEKLFEFVFYALRNANILNCLLSEDELPINTKNINGLSFVECFLMQNKDDDIKILPSFLYKTGFSLTTGFLKSNLYPEFRKYGLHTVEENVIEKWQSITDANSEKSDFIIDYMLKHNIANYKKFILRCYQVKEMELQNFCLLKYCFEYVGEKKLFKKGSGKQFKLIRKFVKFLSQYVNRNDLENLFSDHSKYVKQCTNFHLTMGFWFLKAVNTAIYIDPEEKDDLENSKRYTLKLLAKAENVNFFLKGDCDKTALAHLFSCDHLVDDVDFINQINDLRKRNIQGWDWEEICKQDQTPEGFDKKDRTILEILQQNEQLHCLLPNMT